MSRLRRQVGNNVPNVAETKDLSAIKQKTGNLYESISIIAKRASQINISIKEELHNKLEEFASHTDSLEEIHENKEIRRTRNRQEICRINFFERRRQLWRGE